ncbi:MAG: ATP-dependent DNA helicase RecG, partial [bacterium]
RLPVRQAGTCDLVTWCSCDMRDMTSIQYLKGVGPRKAALLAKLEISSVEDMLFFYPRTWEDRRGESKKPGGLIGDSSSVFRGMVASVKFMQPGRTLGIFKAVLVDSSGKSTEAYWFKRINPRYDIFSLVKRDIREGRSVWVVGRAENSAFVRRISVEEYYLDSDEKSRKVHVGRIIPVYPLTAGITGKFMRETVRRALLRSAASVPDILPASLLEKRKFLGPSQALWGIHLPNSEAELEQSRRRMVYEEFLLITCAWAIKHRQTRAVEKGYSYEIKKRLLTPFRQGLGFDFTAAQKRVINEIFQDMQSPHPMTRLLQGDVGSGKTVVALSALLLAVENGFQGVFMAPTEILAEQHLITLTRFLKNLPVRFELLTSRVRPATRKKILEKTAAGEVDILVGTHALLEESVKFSKLKMAVIDEQHRFGVRQRTVLRQKADNPVDLLIMTATPIPRTLSLSLYGDLDVSILDQLPPGRRPVRTFHVPEEEAFRAALHEIALGRQVYIVHPLIEESDKKELKSVKKEFERLQKDVFRNFRVGLVHGQMAGGEKAKAMEDFYLGKLDMLAATPVIEVGIDMPNASLMIIQNADRFGLASLHQLRGRVGRGESESQCMLVAECRTKEAKDRIDIVCSTHDGFRIGEKDMQMRGPGEVMGVRQHGELELRLGDLVRDAGILREAVEDRDALLKADPDLTFPEHRSFRNRLLELYQRKWHVIDLA